MKQPLIPALFVCALTACAAPTRIPYDHASVPTRAAPAHPLRVAILPLEDARQAREAPDDDGLYLYNGVSYRGTDLAGRHDSCADSDSDPSPSCLSNRDPAPSLPRTPELSCVCNGNQGANPDCHTAGCLYHTE